MALGMPLIFQFEGHRENWPVAIADYTNSFMITSIVITEVFSAPYQGMLWQVAIFNLGVGGFN